MRQECKERLNYTHLYKTLLELTQAIKCTNKTYKMGSALTVIKLNLLQNIRQTIIQELILDKMSHAGTLESIPDSLQVKLI